MSTREIVPHEITVRTAALRRGEIRWRRPGLRFLQSRMPTGLTAPLARTCAVVSPIPLGGLCMAHAVRRRVRQMGLRRTPETKAVPSRIEMLISVDVSPPDHLSVSYYSVAEGEINARVHRRVSSRRLPCRGRRCCSWQFGAGIFRGSVYGTRRESIALPGYRPLE